MILCRNRLLVTISYKHSWYIMILIESILIIELSRKCNRLLIRTSTHILGARLFIISLLAERYYNIFTTIVSPSRNKYRIFIIKRSWVRSGIIYSKHSIEWESFQNLIKIDIHTGIKLELTTRPLTASGSITVSKSISRISLCTSQEILSINNIGSSAQQFPSGCGIGINHVQWNKRSRIFRKIRTCSRCYVPIITFRRFWIVKCSIGINVGINKAIDIYVYITTYVKTVRHIILGFAKIKKISITIITHITIKTRTLTATSNLSSYFRTIICLFYIIRRIVIYICITIWIQSWTMIVNIFGRITEFRSRIIIQEGFIIKCHVLSRT